MCLGRDAGGRGGGLKGGLLGLPVPETKRAEIIWGYHRKPGGIWGRAGLPTGPPCPFRRRHRGANLIQQPANGGGRFEPCCWLVCAGAVVFIYSGVSRSIFIPLLFSIPLEVPPGRLPPQRNLDQLYSIG